MFIRRSGFMLLAAWLLAALAGPGAAQSTSPVYNPANGHWYQVVTPASALSWQQERDIAAGLSYAGLPGHLATITSLQENQFIWDAVIQHNPSHTDYLLGGYQDRSAPDYSEPAGGWRWVTGEPWSFTFWAPGEPNNTAGVEDVLGYWSPQLDHWNDFNPAPRMVPFIVEYEPIPPTGAISVAQLLLFPTSVIGGQSVTGQVILAQPAGPGGVVVALSSSNPAAAVTPATVTVPTGANTLTFPVVTFAVASPTLITISASSPAGGVTTTLQVAPASVPSPAVPPAGSAPVYSPANGHWYQDVRVPGKLTWREAVAAAQALTYAGLPGQLVTVTSAEENQFVATRVIRQDQPAFNYWTGGYQDRSAPDYREPDRGWRWITGEPWGFTNWLPGEPNNGAGNNEDVLIIAPGGGWNDLNEGVLLDAYLVEYEPAARPAPPPDFTVTMSPIGAIGEATVSGTITLAAPAPPGGVIFQLTSSNPAIVSVPPSVTTTAGTTTAVFPVTAHTVAVRMDVTITATAAGIARAATLHLAPPPAPPPVSGPTAPVYSPANGHWYQVVRVPSGIDWPTARAAAQALAYAGMPGHLATLTSVDEARFVSGSVINQTGDHEHFWLGAYQDQRAPDYREPAGGWRWVTGEPFIYANWIPGEPSNSFGDEDVVELARERGDQWNDLPDWAALGGYLVEYEAPTSPVPAPKSTALLLFPNPVPGGLLALGQVILAQPAGPGGVIVSLTSSSAVAVVPPTVAVTPGANSVTFPIVTFPVAASTQVTISAGSPGGGASAVLEVLPTSSAPTSRLLVSSHNNNSVQRYDGQTGAFVDAFVPSGSGGLEGPHGLALGPDGNLYVANRFHRSVLRYNGQTGAFIDAFVPPGSGGLDTPIGLVFGADGNLYVSSFATNSVLRYNGRTGAFLDAFVPAGSGGLEEPYALIFGPDGNLYVTSRGTSRVLRYDGRTGIFLGTFVPPGSGGLDGPNGMVFGPDGNLYVSSWKTNSVLRYDGRSGTSLGAFVPSGSGGLTEPWGMAFGADGNLYVTSAGTDSVLRYDGRTGAFRGAFVSGSGLARPDWLLFLPGEVSPPSFPSSGNLLVNGSFEEPRGDRFGVSDGVPGWRILKGTIDILTASYWQSAPDGGSQSIDLVGTPGAATIEQSFATEPRREYLFSGWISHNPSIPEGRANVFLNGQFFIQLFHRDPGSTNRDMRWVPFAYRFQATAPTTTLRLEDVTNLWDAGGGLVLDGLAVTPADAPSAASEPLILLSARMIINARIQLAWTDRSQSNAGLVVWRKSGGSDFQQIAVLAPRTTGFIDTGIGPNTTYTYQVRTIGDMPSIQSNDASVTTPLQPAAPVGLRASQVGPTQITLAWDANSDNALAMEVYRRRDGGDWVLVDVLSPDRRSFSDRGLSPGTRYTYRVRAANDYFASGWSNEAAAITLPGV